MSSLVNQVLQDDQVFAFLGGESRGPKRQSPLLGPGLQETMDCSTKIDEYNALYGRTLVCDNCLSLKRITKKALFYFKNI